MVGTFLVLVLPHFGHSMVGSSSMPWLTSWISSQSSQRYKYVAILSFLLCVHYPRTIVFQLAILESAHIARVETPLAT